MFDDLSEETLRLLELQRKALEGVTLIGCYGTHDGRRKPLKVIEYADKEWGKFRFCLSTMRGDESYWDVYRELGDSHSWMCTGFPVATYDPVDSIGGESLFKSFLAFSE